MSQPNPVSPNGFAGHTTHEGEVDLNQVGVSHAKVLIAAGQISDEAWEFTAADSDKLLGAGSDWANYGKWFLATDRMAAKESKEYFKYPYGKEGKIYRRALASIRSRASQQKATAVYDAAGELLDAISKRAQGQHAARKPGRMQFSVPERMVFRTGRQNVRFKVTPREGKLPLLSGYAMCWNQLSDDRGGYKVRLKPNSPEE